MANPNTITTTHIQDIQITDNSLSVQYYNYWLQGNYANAFALLGDYPQLESKIVSATNFNNLINGIIALENYYKNNTTDVFNSLSATFQISISNLINTNVFLATKQYYVNNFCFYNDSVYFCIVNPPIGTLPTNTTYWLYLGLKGQQGAKSFGLDLRGLWDNTTTYALNDVVVSANAMYISLANNNIENVPTASPTQWLLIFSITRRHITIAASEPSGTIEGDIWLKDYENGIVEFQQKLSDTDTDQLYPISPAGLLPCTYSYQIGEHIFYSIIPIKQDLNIYLIRAKVSQNFTSGDTLTLTDGVNTYNGIILKTIENETAPNNTFVSGVVVSINVNLQGANYYAFEAI